ncbi:cytochrome P450 [Actinoplanes teichomyceticus]|uniref:Cytochrome P450 n=1 Tax=Actinoplanes teichomyceticus TaxID=1867 RepID=A0A561VIC8_ACTTI|nr:cytochrome P450 [Actinoplanes teichomyceticus]TWG11378.1 cytochrome P450 [Actinoplanes teichomyceticus]GIF15808.1 cytochrome P450 [Actinoplanes teichomyceticus]
MLQFPLVRECPYAPPAEYTQIREDEPITTVRLPNGREAWVVTKHEHVRQVLNDPSFSADRLHPDFPNLAPAGQPIPRDDTARSMLMMDPPEHGPARKTVLGEFTVRRIAALRPRIQEIVDERIDVMLAGPRPADLVETLSLPVPSMVICELLGVPYADHAFFQANTAAMIKRETTVDDRQAAFERIRDYLEDLIVVKEADPPDDLLGRQIRKRRSEGAYERAPLVSLGFLLLVAGHETTANMISLGTLALLENPAQMHALRADPARTLGAVEEMLRYFTIVDTVVARLCTADTTVGGVPIRAGEGVLTLGQAANRDPDAFDAPDDFDIDRPARHHVAFGFGPHQCLGQNLARAELQIVFDTLLRRVPTLRLAAPVADLPFKSDAAIYGMYHMPVTW